MSVQKVNCFNSKKVWNYFFQVRIWVRSRRWSLGKKRAEPNLFIEGAVIIGGGDIIVLWVKQALLIVQQLCQDSANRLLIPKVLSFSWQAADGRRKKRMIHLGCTFPSMISNIYYDKIKAFIQNSTYAQLGICSCNYHNCKSLHYAQTQTVSVTLW